MHSTCKHCGKPIVGVKAVMNENNIHTQIEIWGHPNARGGFTKTACDDGKHNAEPDES